MNKTDDLSKITRSHSRLLVHIALMYYSDGYTQKEIGEQLELSRIKVNRLLQEAREVGIVEININTPPDVYASLEQALYNMYGIREAVVVPEAEPGQALYRALAEGAAEWLADRLIDGLVIGIGQGRTISSIPQVFSIDRAVNCTFVEVVGGENSKPGGFGSYNITSKMAELVGGQGRYVYAPTIVSSRETRDTFLREATIADALDLARRADIVVHSVGPVDRTALLHIHGYLDDDALDQLRALGAVGDTLSRFFNQDGECVPHPICDRVVGLSLDDLRQIPYSVVVAGGAEKVPVLQAAMRSRLLNVLVTDVATATALLER
jgi:DNA-binding transcriptional regulator LsrR (DeoR family)